MPKTRITFFGTHEFAATVLKGLIESPFFEIITVITQPDRPVGRKQELQEPAIKILAKKYNLHVEQPESLKGYELRITNYELNIVAQYGLLIPKHILEAPARGTINVHTSILPKYRGASPIQSAIIHGETETGVTIMLMDEGLDTGPILSQRVIPILPDETYPDLDKKLAVVGRDLLIQSIPFFLDESLKPLKQDNAQATICKKLDRDDGRVNWSTSAQEIYNLYRGLHPWPGIWTTWQGKRLKLLRIKKSTTRLPAGQVAIKNGIIEAGCTDGAIEILELQLEGKKAIPAKEFIAGYGNSIEGNTFR